MLFGLIIVMLLGIWVFSLLWWCVMVVFVVVGECWCVEWEWLWVWLCGELLFEE